MLVPIIPIQSGDLAGQNIARLTYSLKFSEQATYCIFRLGRIKTNDGQFRAIMRGRKNMGAADFLLPKSNQPLAIH
jgi:hypothetical protein